MINLNELMSVILKIRNTADVVTVTGHADRNRINFIYSTCNELLNQLEGIRQKAQKEEKESEQDIPENVIELKGE